jgi:hypothetical protein
MVVAKLDNRTLGRGPVQAFGGFTPRQNVETRAVSSQEEPVRLAQQHIKRDSQQHERRKG